MKILKSAQRVFPIHSAACPVDSSPPWPDPEAQCPSSFLCVCEREVQLTSRLNHPNTIAIYDFGRTPEGIFYYATEYLEGINLEELVQRFGAQPENRVIFILRQIFSSLAEAHRIGLIHRDIKPANILLTERGGLYDFVKLLDFGLVKAVDSQKEAKLTKAGGFTGTPLYLSPEAICNPDSVDARSDLYAVGAVGDYLLTGSPVLWTNEDAKKWWLAHKPVRHVDAQTAETDETHLGVTFVSKRG